MTTLRPDLRGLDDRLVPRAAQGLRALLSGRALDRLDDRVVRGPLAPVRRRPEAAAGLAVVVALAGAAVVVVRAVL